jgi:thiosulfate/3-mercaptopyruvate sulfurtransferase
VDVQVPPVVDRDWLRREGGGVVLADVRWYLDGRSGRSVYEAGHLPGAVFVDLDAVLAAPHRLRSSTAGRHPLPDPAAFAAAMSALGIGDDDVIVGYDDDGGVVAARLIWMLRATGHPAALLDGGLQQSDGLTTEVLVRPPARFTARPWPAQRLADLATVTDRSTLVLDARARERYRGDVEPIDARAGHIPGSRSLPARENLTVDCFVLPVPQLRARFAEVGVDGPAAATRVVSSCGSGVTACHTLLLLEHTGLGQGRLYPGSWSAYCSDPTLPVASGDEPG